MAHADWLNLQHICTVRLGRKKTSFFPPSFSLDFMKELISVSCRVARGSPYNTRQTQSAATKSRFFNLQSAMFSPIQMIGTSPNNETRSDSNCSYTGSGTDWSLLPCGQWEIDTVETGQNLTIAGYVLLPARTVPRPCVSRCLGWSDQLEWNPSMRTPLHCY